MISNGGEYRLNQETLDAIRRGTFLQSEAIRSELMVGCVLNYCYEGFWYYKWYMMVCSMI